MLNRIIRVSILSLMLIVSTAGLQNANATPTTAGTGGGAAAAATTVRTRWNSLTPASKIFRGLGVIGGGLLVYQGTVGNGPHSWSDVLYGALGGLTIGASVGTFTGPAYPFVVAGATIAGAAAGGAKFFSESGGDCVYDPIMMGGNTVYTCCNTVYNKGMRWVGPGGTMFCELSNGSPGVQTCLNGGSTTTDSPLKNDKWGPCEETDTMWCPGVSKPTDETGVIYIPTLDGLQSKIAEQKQSKIQGKTEEISFTEDDLKNVKICWDWACDSDSGYKKEGDHCVPGSDVQESGTRSSSDPYDVLINKIQTERQRIINTCGQFIGASGLF